MDLPAIVRCQMHCCCQLASSIAKMWCLAVSVSAVHNDSTVSVVSFDIAGTLKQKVGVALPASAAQPPKKAILRAYKVQKFWLPSVSVGDPAEKRQLPFGSCQMRRQQRSQRSHHNADHRNAMPWRIDCNYVIPP